PRLQRGGERVWEGLVAGETGNEEFWACLSTLILQLTGRQQGLQKDGAGDGSGQGAEEARLPRGGDTAKFRGLKAGTEEQVPTVSPV
ncbi:hypothetical protein KUCAC02_023835, partial [Chaenocephalus aceratus]